MKWFRHFSDAHDNQKLQLFMAAYPRSPLEAYGFYWLLLEIVAKQMDETDACEVEYPILFLARKFGISAQKLRGFVQNLTRIRAIDAEISASFCKIKIPKLLEYRDEHTRKLRSKTGVTPDKVAPEVDTDTEVDNNKNNNKGGSIVAEAPKIRTLDRTRCPLDPPTHWMDWSKSERGWDNQATDLVWKKFQRYQNRKIGQSALLVMDDWFEEWKLWCLKENIRPEKKLKKQGGGHVATAEEHRNCDWAGAF